MDRAVQNATIVHCALHNASYQVDLTYVNREQTIHARDITVFNGVSHFGGITNMDFEKSKLSSDTSFSHNPYLMESVSYQSIMEAFGGLLFGSISNEIHVSAKAQSDQNVTMLGTNNLNTSILTTSLKNTEEIRFIQSIISPGAKSPFEDYWDGRYVSASNESFPVLSKALEELFRNITFSLMSSNMFQ